MSAPIFSPYDCAVIAEAGQTMEGSVPRAIEMARAAKDAGCWGFKTQLLKPELIAADGAEKYWHDDFGTNDQREAFAAAGLIDYGAWAEVAKECQQMGIRFCATPFDVGAVEAIAEHVSLFKVASGDITFRRLLDAVADKGKLVLLSTGASEADEIGRAYDLLTSAGCEVVLLACSLVYPCPAKEANLARIGQLLRFSDGQVGYSDHTTEIFTGGRAAAAGAVLCEKHYTWAGAAGPVADHAMGLDKDAMGAYVVDAHAGAVMRGEGALSSTREEQRARIGARRLLRAARNLPEGHVLQAEDLIELRPAASFIKRSANPWHWAELVGARLKRPMRAGEPFLGDDLTAD